MQPDEPCDGTCNDLDEDIASQEDDHNEAFEQMVEDNNANTVDNNIIVIDEDAQSDYSNKNSAATDTIYIDDTAEDVSNHTPDKILVLCGLIHKIFKMHIVYI